MKKINYAKQFVGISDEESKTSIHSRRFLLFNYTDILVKNKSSQDFDIIIGVLDSAEICKLVVLYSLHILQRKI